MCFSLIKNIPIKLYYLKAKCKINKICHQAQAWWWVKTEILRWTTWIKEVWTDNKLCQTTWCSSKDNTTNLFHNNKWIPWATKCMMDQMVWCHNQTVDNLTKDSSNLTWIIWEVWAVEDKEWTIWEWLFNKKIRSIKNIRLRDADILNNIIIAL